jgi:Helix-turn-helix domain
MNEDKAGEPFLPRMLLDGASIPEAILRDPTLSPSARLLWGILAAYQGNSRECSPLEEALAVDLGVKVRQLQSYLKELENNTRGDPPEAVPLLAVTWVWVEKDRKTRNSYTLLGQPFLGVAPKEAGTTRAHFVNGGDAQSVAHRSGANTQNMQPVPPGIPSEEGGIVGPDVSPRDRQSSAHRSQGDPPDTGRRPAIPGGDAGTVPDNMQPGDVGARVITTPSHELRRPLTQLSDPALLGYAERQLGPRDCKRHSFPGKCKKCGATVTETHLMLRLIGGAFCE